MISIETVIYFYSFFIVVCFFVLRVKILELLSSVSILNSDRKYFKSELDKLRDLYLKDLDLKTSLQKRLNHINKELSKLTNPTIES